MSGTLKDTIQVHFADFEMQLNGSANKPLHGQRKSAFAQFNKLGFPNTRHEEWKYSPVKKIIERSYALNTPSEITQQDLDSLSIPNLQGNILYFVNGVFDEGQSKIISKIEDIIICGLEKAEKEYSDIFNQYFNQNIDNEASAFSALNTAFTKNGVFIHVPAGHKITEPVIIRYINDTRAGNVMTQPRNLVIAENAAELQIVESFRTLGQGSSFTNIYTEIFVAENADVHYYKVQNESDDAAHIGTTAVHQKGKSVFTANTVTTNGGFVRNNLNIKVDGEYAVANMFGLYIPSGNQHVDNHTVVDHMLPNSESNEMYKGVLSDKATGVFNGKIFVRQDAQKTNAFQSCKNVLSSSEATMNTKPQLEIWADDVKCSHGTTTGQLNDDALFYLRARGIGKDAAKSLLMLAFAQDVIDKMEIAPIKDYLQGLVQDKLYNI